MSTLRIRRAALPLASFVLVLGAHVAYRTVLAEPEHDCEVIAPSAPRSRLAGYLASRAYFLGLSYASAGAFAATSFLRFRERRLRADRSLALGGLTVSGLLALAGCYTAGCCGSPMVGVYVSLLGPQVLPWTGPITLGLTIASLAGGWSWMRIRERRAGCCDDATECSSGAPSPTSEPRLRGRSRGR